MGGRGLTNRIVESARKLVQSVSTSKVISVEVDEPGDNTTIDSVHGDFVKKVFGSVRVQLLRGRLEGGVEGWRIT